MLVSHVVVMLKMLWSYEHTESTENWIEDVFCFEDD